MGLEVTAMAAYPVSMSRHAGGSVLTGEEPGLTPDGKLPDSGMLADVLNLLKSKPS